MLPMPDQEGVRLRSLPWVLLTVMLCYLLVLVSWQAQESQQRRELLSWYQDSGLFEMEWAIYLPWLRFNGQRAKAQRFEQARADGELMAPFLDMAFNPRFEAENRERGLDYWSPRRFDKWKNKRASFKQRAKSLPSYFAGLRPSDPRPGRFVTWHFLQHGLLAWILMLVVLAPFAWPLEARLGKGPTVVLWLLGGVVAGLGPVWLFPRVYNPVIGSSGVVSALIGGFASLHARERLRFRYFHPRRRQWTNLRLPALVLLPLWLILPLWAFWRTDQGPILLAAQGFGLAGGALLAQLLRDTGMRGSEDGDREDEPDQARARALTEGWNALARFEFADAEKHFLAARETAPDDFDALTGLIQVRKVNPGECCFHRTLTELIRHRPDDADQARQRELLLRQLVGEERLTEVPETIVLEIARLLARSGALQQAENLAGAALDRGSQSQALPRALHALAEAYENRGDPGRAEGFRRKAGGNA